MNRDKTEIHVFIRACCDKVAFEIHKINLTIPFYSPYVWTYKVNAILSPRKINSMFKFKPNFSLYQILIPYSTTNVINEAVSLSNSSEVFIKTYDLFTYLNFVKPKNFYPLPKIEIQLK